VKTIPKVGRAKRKTYRCAAFVWCENVARQCVLPDKHKGPHQMVDVNVTVGTAATLTVGLAA
jgi:hypothetical protein